jgi:phosphoglycerate-specific signal transduction histidine kinase
VILQDSRALLSELDRVLYNMFLVREKVGNSRRVSTGCTMILPLS